MGRVKSRQVYKKLIAYLKWVYLTNFIFLIIWTIISAILIIQIQKA